MRSETLYETQYKCLVFDDCAIGNKYKIYHLVRYDRHETWELFQSYLTLEEAYRAYEKIPNVATERGEAEWLCQLLCM